jgi:1,4-alpha-glucan branching enzyme
MTMTARSRRLDGIRGTFAMVLIAFLMAPPVAAQDSLDVVFRYLPDLTGSAPTITNAYLPGTFNNWGPNSGGQIAVNAPSRMTFVDEHNEYHYTIRLRAGVTHQYKIHYHTNSSGSQNVWMTDPLNPLMNPADNNNSVLELADPMVFQQARRQDTSGDIVEFSATILSSAEIDSLGFEINGVLLDGLPHFDASTGIFRYVPDEPSASGAQFAVGARTVDGERASASVGVRPPDVVDEAPPAGIRYGITYGAPSSGTASFKLYAPGKSFVHLIGDFNDWEIDDAFVLKRHAPRPDSVMWWITLDGLQPGTEYAFQYLVNGELRVADPFSSKVLDPNFDQYILNATYPNLKPYPLGKTSEIVSVVRPPEDEVRVVEPRAVTPHHELVLYELLIRDFLHDATYETLRDTLGYLKRLGVNAVSLMPVSQFDGNNSWGYNPTFHAAVEKAYGPRYQLEEFVQAARREGLVVIVDVVYNHTHEKSPLVRLFGNDASNPLLQIPPSHPYNVFRQLNHDHPFVHYYIDRANEFWLAEIGVDGFRFDLTKGFMTGGNVDGYNAARIANLKRMADAIWSVELNPVDTPEEWQPYLILEHFAADAEERELAAYRTDEGKYGMMFWNNLNRAYSQAVMGYTEDANLARTYFGPGGRNWTHPNTVAYMESHDEQWLMLKMRKFGNQGPGYSTRELGNALDRMKMAGAFFLTVPGPRMLWQFGELGYGYGDRECLKPGDGSSGDCESSDPGRTSTKPIRWNYYQDDLRQKLYRTWSELLRLRADHSVFRDLETEVSLNTSGPVKYITLRHEEMDVVIVGNFDVNEREVSLGFPAEGMWYSFFDGTSLKVEAPSVPHLMPPGQFYVYTSEWVEPAEPGLITVSVEDGPEIAHEFTLSQNYPNPFNPSTEIVFTLPRPGEVRLEVFDMLGRRVALLVDGVHPAGPSSVRFDAGALSSGTYFYRISAFGEIHIRPMTLIK